MEIRRAKFEDLNEISNLMISLYTLKMKKFYTEEGQENFEDLITMSSLQTRFHTSSIFYIALIGNEIIGLIELEQPCHIAFLFSKEEGKGIARVLLNEALSDNTEEVCTVGAFSEALGFYTKLGFIKVADEKNINGLKYTLMAKLKPLQ